MDPTRVVAVTTPPDPVKREDIQDLCANLIVESSPEINIARWWNHAMDLTRELAGPITHELLVVSSDATGDFASLALMADLLRKNDLAMVGPDWHGVAQLNSVAIQHLDTPRTVFTRVPGACFMVANELGLRVDEDFRWWYSDDDFEMQAKKLKGVGLIGGTTLKLGYDSPLSEEKALYAIEDRNRFIHKWGTEPW